MKAGAHMYIYVGLGVHQAQAIGIECCILLLEILSGYNYSIGNHSGFYMRVDAGMLQHLGGPKCDDSWRVRYTRWRKTSSVHRRSPGVRTQNNKN